jgi:hypothetical protein
MLTTLLILRYVGIVAWLAVLWRLRTPTRRAFSKEPLQFDPFWALISLLVLNRLAYQGSSLVFPQAPDTMTEAVWRLFLQLWSIGMAGGIILLKRWFKAQQSA